MSAIVDFSFTVRSLENPSLTYTVNYENTDQTPESEPEHSIEKTKALFLELARHKKSWPIFYGLVSVVRLDSLSAFCKDLLLPTWINHVLTIQNVALKVLLTPFAIALDVLFLPLRLISLPTRAIENSLKTKHPLLVFLKIMSSQDKFANEKQLEVLLKYRTAGSTVVTQDGVIANLTDLPENGNKEFTRWVSLGDPLPT